MRRRGRTPRPARGRLLPLPHNQSASGKQNKQHPPCTASLSSPFGLPVPPNKPHVVYDVNAAQAACGDLGAPPPPPPPRTNPRLNPITQLDNTPPRPVRLALSRGSPEGDVWRPVERAIRTLCPSGDSLCPRSLPSPGLLRVHSLHGAPRTSKSALSCQWRTTASCSNILSSCSSSCAPPLPRERAAGTRPCARAAAHESVHTRTESARTHAARESARTHAGRESARTHGRDTRSLPWRARCPRRKADMRVEEIIHAERRR